MHLTLEAFAAFQMLLAKIGAKFVVCKEKSDGTFWQISPYFSLFFRAFVHRSVTGSCALLFSTP
jgi:hypothetical protein